MKISIITPCYNSAKTISYTLKSVEDQGWLDMEHIIIDGASSDGTLELLKEYGERVSYDVKIVSEPDEGIYDAMNKGIRMASGNLIGIINSDDWYEDDTIKLVTRAYTGALYEIIYGIIRTYQHEKLKTLEFYHHDFLLDRMINHPGCFVTRALYDEIGLFDNNYRSSADYEWMKRALDAGAVFTPVYEILANVRLGGMSAGNVGFRETLQLQYEWGRISRHRYMLYSIKSLVGDVYHRIKHGRGNE